MRLIDADALKNEFPKDSDWDYPVSTNSYVCEMIDAQPTIEPERKKRKKGKWIGVSPLVDTEQCSLCGYQILNNQLRTPFCPWCGADVRESKDE